jgi:type I restriction enzyme S subunit
LAADDDGAIAIGPFGSSMKADVYTDSGIPVVRGNNLTGHHGFHGDFVFVPPAVTDRFPRCLVKPGDLVFPHRGAIGEVGLVIDQGYSEWMLSTSMMKLRVHPHKLV